MMADLEDGIYFDLDEDTYHALPALGSTDLKRLNISPADYWEGSHLNPDREDDDDADATNAQIIGRAYHIARLEPEKFHTRYIRQPEKSEFENVEGYLSSDAAIRAELKARDLTQKIGDESIPERARRLVEAGYEGPIWALIMDEFEAERTKYDPPSIGIAGKVFDDIERDMKRIQDTPEIQALLSGGQPEVSILWTDENNIRCKARIDYLAAKHWADFKTFDTRGKVLEQTIPDAFRYNGYYMQGSHYRDAVEAVRAGLIDIVGDATGVQHDLVAAIQQSERPQECFYVFQQKRGVPNLIAYKVAFMQIDVYRDHEIKAMVEDENQAAIVRDMMSARSALYMKGIRDVARAKSQFMLYSQAYPDGQPWAPFDNVRTLGDADFNSFWLEDK